MATDGAEWNPSFSTWYGSSRWRRHRGSHQHNSFLVHNLQC